MEVKYENTAIRKFMHAIGYSSGFRIYFNFLNKMLYI